jgi:hypothetical protein
MSISAAGTRALGVRASRLSSIPNGTRVRLYAVARAAAQTLRSPVLHQPCLAYRVVVERPGWHKLLDRADCIPFLAEDGEIVISVRGPFDVVLSTAYQWEFGLDVKRRLDSLLPGPPWKDYRYFEALIRPGERICIEGFASVAVDPAGERTALREPPLLYTVAGTPDWPAVVSVPEQGSVAP